MTGQRRGFTLIEMLIVGSLIALFAGLAMIGAQQMYESNKKKAIMDETKSIGTTLSAARQDVGFYPRICFLGTPIDLIRYASPNVRPTLYYVRPSLDTYGYYGSGAPGVANIYGNPVFQILHYWKAPYMTLTEARKANASGRRTGLVKVRLSDAETQRFFRNVNGEDLSIVDWPTDAWGNPYMVYHVCTDLAFRDPATNPRGLRLINRANEEANYFNAVVSYGPNHVPGGQSENRPTSPGYPGEELFVVGDLYGTPPVADFTLKSVNATNAAAMLPNPTLPGAAALNAAMAQSIEARLTNPNNPGIFDDGSDDIFFKF